MNRRTTDNLQDSRSKAWRADAVSRSSLAIRPSVQSVGGRKPAAEGFATRKVCLFVQNVYFKYYDQFTNFGQQGA